MDGQTISVMIQASEETETLKDKNLAVSFAKERRCHWIPRCDWTSFSLSCSLFPSRVFTGILTAHPCISASPLLLFSKNCMAWMKPIKTRRKTVKDTMDGLKIWKKSEEREGKGVHENGGERPSFFSTPGNVNAKSHHHRCHPSYFLTPPPLPHHTPPTSPKLAANVCQTASPAANCSLRRHDGWEGAPLCSDGMRGRRGGGGQGDCADHTLYTSGDAGQKKKIEAL